MINLQFSLKEGNTIIHTYQTTLANRPLVVEVGEVAKQANGAAVVRYGDTVVLVTATASNEPREGVDFFPLTVDFEEKQYAVGKIPGGFLRREFVSIQYAFPFSDGSKVNSLEGNSSPYFTLSVSAFLKRTIIGSSSPITSDV